MTVIPDEQLQAEVRKLMDASSVRSASRKLRVAAATAARVAGGLPVAEGTILLMRQRLSEIDTAA